MRPHKHVTHSLRPAQRVFDISVARCHLDEGSVPLVVTAEREALTLFAWHPGGLWADYQIPHARIQVPRGDPSIKNSWNWSRHVGLAAANEFIYVVYKRAKVPNDDDAPEAQLMLAKFQLSSGEHPILVETFPIPMPSYRVGTGVNLYFKSKTPGFELWTGVDENRGHLHVVTQTLREDSCTLTLMIGNLDRLDRPNSWEYRDIDVGGYGLDVRRHEDQLLFAYRKTAPVVTVPFPIWGPMFFEPVGIPSSPESDHFYAPLQLTILDLVSGDLERLELPGGEHPRIQSVNPLLVTVDRPYLQLKYNASLPAENLWEIGDVRKIAYLLDEQRRLARGWVFQFEQGSSPTFPRTAERLANAQDLFTADNLGIGWASTWPRMLLEPLSLWADDKDFVFDFLHQTPCVALHRSRARLTPNFDAGTFIVEDLKTEIFDINHAQISELGYVRPEVTPDNRQFAPFQKLRQSSPITVSAYLVDNTIGGSLVNDRDGVPYQFIAYTDLGDGGLRVIFDNDLPAPTEPVPIPKDKLEPESVPGPGSQDERWIELTATDFQDAGVPKVMFESGVFDGWPTVTSQHQLNIERFFSLMTSLDMRMTDEGWGESEFSDFQSALVEDLLSSERRPANDDIEPAAFITLGKSRLFPGTAISWTAEVEGTVVNAVAWQFTSGSGDDSQSLSATGNSITFALPSAGTWTVTAEITLTDGTPRTVSTEVIVEEFVMETFRELYEQLAKPGEEDASSPMGTFSIGTVTLRFLQYELTFRVPPGGTMTDNIFIGILDSTIAEWRFKADLNKQGRIEYRLPLTFLSDDIRLDGFWASLVRVERVRIPFFFQRAFTPAVLMNDRRTDDLLEHPDTVGHPLGQDSNRLASSITARPVGNSKVTVKREMISVRVSVTPQATAALVVTLLVGLGALALAATLLLLIGAAAAIGGGIIAALILVIIYFALPAVVSQNIADKIEAKLTDPEFAKRLEEDGLLQFGGEGIGLAMARRVITDASLEPVVGAGEFAGRDRFRQNLFQMIHVCEGRCRVLIRG